MKRRTDKQRLTRLRKGILLPIAAVISVLWTLSAYQFSEQLLCHLSLAVRTRNEIAARTCIASATTWLSAFPESTEWSSSNTVNNPKLFSNISEGTELAPMMYSVVSPLFVQAPGAGQSVRFGLEDESSKLDINWLARESKDGRAQLMHLPDMTLALADSLLDWIDADDTPREFGAERNYYFSRGDAVLPPNDEIQDLSELLNVRGVTREMLFGMQTESDFSEPVYDPNQRSRDDLPSSYEAMGWAQFLTTYAGEAAAQESDRVIVNSPKLPELYEELRKQRGDEGAKFIVAVRLAGILERPAGAQKKRPEKSVKSRLDDQLRGKAVLPDPSEGDSTVDGLDLTRAPQFEIHSLFDLIGTNVRIVIDGKDEVLTSPWKATGNGAEAALTLLDKALDMRPEKVLRGRLNVNTAPRELLKGLPELSEAKLNKILETRDRQLGKQSGNGPASLWLISEGVLTIEEIRRLAPFLTDRGSVFTGTICAYSPQQGAVYRRKVTIDGTASPPVVSRQLNLPPGDASFRAALQKSVGGG